MKKSVFKVVSGVIFTALSSSTLADHPTVAFGIGGSGAIQTISADPAPVGVWGFGLQTEVIDNDAFSTEQLEGFAASGFEGVHSTDSISNTSVSVSYGLTKDFSLSARLPYIKRKNIREGEIEDDEPEAHTHGDSSGFGDLVLLGQYRAFEYNKTNISFNFGVKLPTGETDEKDDDDIRFETEFQPGTGSTDFILGAAISTGSGSFGYHANVLYNKTNEGSQSTEIGDVIAYNAALTYRINNHVDHNHQHANTDGLKWNLILELNGESRRRDKVSGDSEQNTGGTSIFFSPGLRVSGSGLTGFISYGVPVVENQHGIQADIDQRIVAGVSAAF